MRITWYVGLGMMVGCTFAGELVVEHGGLTPEGAKEAIRAAKAAGNKEAWTVRVRPGSYLFKKTLVFEPQDSGTPDAPVTWIGEGDGAVFTGGEEISDWTEVSDGVWSADAPRDNRGAPIYFESLYVDGRRAQRARMPNEGFFLPGKIGHSTVTAAVTKVVTYVDTLTGQTNDLSFLRSVPTEELAYGQLLVHHNWNETRRILRAFDPTTQTITTTGLQPLPAWNNWKTSSLYFVENVRSAFDAPGEWFYDGVAGKVLYRPLPGERMKGGCPLAFWRKTVKFVAPTSKLGVLVAFRGDFEHMKFVHDISFRNLTFAYGDAPDVTGSKGPSQAHPLQAAKDAEGIVMVDGARHLLLEDCVITHTGNYAIWLRAGCMSNRISRCSMIDLGAGGIRIGLTSGRHPTAEGAGRKPVTAFTPASTAFNTVDNCIIRKCGRFYAEGVGVFIGHASDTTITHNDISDLYYSGVSVGWVWGYAGSVAQRNTIAFNRIHKIGQAQLADMGGVYTLGTSFGTCVSNNVIWDVDSYSYGGWGLYTDEGSEGVVMENNLVVNTKDGSFHQHYGANNTIRNNILCFNRQGGAVRTQRVLVQGVRSSVAVENNIVCIREGMMVPKSVLNVDGAWKNNLWFDLRGKADFDGMDFAAWQKTGKEKGGREADPKFADADAMDFRLPDDSPAFELGFKRFDTSTSGVYGPMKGKR